MREATHVHFDDLRKNTEVTKFWMPNHIPASGFPANTTLRWLPSDSEEQYRLRGNKAYGPDSLDYRLNSRGYRSIEPDGSSSAKKIMFVGCSFTMGIGLPYDEIWTTEVTRQLSEAHGCEIEQHNFGLAGYGADAIAMTIFQVLPLLKPDLLIVLFPDMSRRAHFNAFDDRIPILMSSENKVYPETWKAYAQLQSDATDFFDFVRNIRLIELTAARHNIPWVWQIMTPTIPYPDLSLYAPTDHLIEKRFPDFLTAKDFARDNMHAGASSNREFANRVMKHLKKKAIFQP